MEDRILLKEPMYKLFIKFVIPSILAMLFVGIQGVVDGLFLGRFESINAMSSVNIANPFMQLVLSGCVLISVGMVSRMGRMIGGNNEQEAKITFKTGFVAVSVWGFLLLGIGSIFHTSLTDMLGANATLFSDSSRYIFVLSFFIPSICLMIVCGFSTHLMERPYLYVFATICCLVVNVVLDFFMIAVLKMSVIGAALSTGIAYTIGFIIVAIPFLQRRTLVNFFDGKVRFYALKEILFNGLSEGISYLALAISIFLMNRKFMYFASEQGVAAFTAIHYITSFEELIMIGVADGVASIISCNYGAKQYNRAKQALYIAAILNFSIGILFYSILLFRGEIFIAIFIKENIEVLNLAVEGGKLYGIAFLLNGWNILQSGYYTALGRALLSALIALSRGLIFIIIGIYTLPLLLQMNGIWLTLPFAEMMTIFITIVIAIYYKKHFQKYVIL